MPIRIPGDLPARTVLERENIFVMTEDRALHQDIRPLQIAIVNFMPTKIATENQLLRLLSNTPIQADVTLVRPEHHQSSHKNTSFEHLSRFYTTFSQIENRKFDGVIITGAPVEHIDFMEVDYWEEFKDIMDWTLTNVFSTLYICWGAQAGLYHFYGIEKFPLPSKMFGIFAHRINNSSDSLLRGFDDIFFAPHSRHTEVRRNDVLACPRLELMAESEQAGILLIKSRQANQVFITGHLEYEADTLAREYQRDLNLGREVRLPYNYFPQDDPGQPPIMSWRAHAHLFFSNWLNYYVYQETPYIIEQIKA